MKLQEAKKILSGTVLFHVLGMLALMAVCVQTAAHGTVGNRMDDVNHALEHDPKDAKLYLKRGRIHQEKQAWDKALADYERALQLDRKLHEVVYWKGMLHFERAEYGIAEQQFKKYIGLSDSPQGHIALGELYLQTARPELSARHYDQSVRLDVNPAPVLYLKRARALQQAQPAPLSAGYLNAIVAGIDEGIARHGELATYLEFLVGLYEANGDYARALATIERLHGKLRSTPAWQLVRAELLLKAGDKESAAAAYQAAITAVEQLPDHRSNVKANAEVKQQAQLALHRLESNRQTETR
jgi:tetratricopeptide (TPR) repeat protein